jgi:DNA adenine methylase
MVGKPGYQKPYLKWAGSKYNALAHVLPLIPIGKRLIEPFCGTCCVSLNTAFRSYILNDKNRHLIDSYRQLRRQGSAYIEYVSRVFNYDGNLKEVYDAYRKAFNSQETDNEFKAVLFPYLNRHCYNGLWRVNSIGEFNVPFGRYTKPYFPGDEMLEMYRFLTQNDVCLESMDFRDIIAIAGRGDVVYIDPPYFPDRNDFKSSAEGFCGDDQHHIVYWSRLAVDRGATLVISNRDCDKARKLYHDADEIHSFSVRQSISRDGTKRGLRPELVAVYKPKGGRK